MTATVSLNALGVLKALDVVLTGRNDAARRHETEPHRMPVSVGPSAASPRPADRGRIVDLFV